MNETNLAIKFLPPEESEELLDSAALELFDHIAEILGAEYVQAIKNKEQNNNHEQTSGGLKT